MYYSAYLSSPNTLSMTNLLKVLPGLWEILPLLNLPFDVRPALPILCCRPGKLESTSDPLSMVRHGGTGSQVNSKVFLTHHVDGCCKHFDSPQGLLLLAEQVDQRHKRM